VVLRDVLARRGFDCGEAAQGFKTNSPERPPLAGACDPGIDV